MMFRFTLLLIVFFMLGGCALTRVSDATHAKEVDELDAIGLSLDAARDRAIQKGFVCDKSIEPNVSVQTKSGVRKMMILRCDKESMEVICPQRRYIAFMADPESSKVNFVGKHIRQRSCF
jgi:hypothetical protein